jgi:copper chaperone
MSKITLKVKGMTCNHCVKSVENAVSRLDGVTQVHVTLAEGKVEVDVNNEATTADVIAERIEDQGFTVVSK